MKVLFLTMNPNRQSTTVPTEGWFTHLGSCGLQPVLVSDRSGAFQAWTHEQGIPSYEVPLPFPDKRHPWPFLNSLMKAVRIARRHHIQLVHCNEHDIYPIGQYVARLLRVPVVLSVHFTLRDGFSRWAFGGARCPDRVFFISRGSLEACRPDVAGVVPENRWRVLYNGLDLERFSPDAARRDRFRRAHAGGSSFMIGVACALRPRKQLEHLFHAAAAITTPGLRVVIAGGAVAGDERYGDELLALGRRLLGDRLSTLGHVEDLRDFYNGLDLFVNTSQEEACSISVIEALACGCPIVGYPSTSVDEQVLPDGGQIVEQDSVRQLAGALQQWLAAPDRLAAARQRARAQAVRLFDIRQTSRQLWHEYSTLIGQHSQRKQEG